MVAEASRFISFNFPHNPTGKVIDRQSFDAIIELARERGIYVFSDEVYRLLEQEFASMALHRPMRIERYEAGTELEYDVIGVDDAVNARLRLVIDKFIGGGFAGQVYRVKVIEIISQEQSIDQIKVGGVYAVKILIPPSGFSRLFRNALYWIGFQGPFQLQVNPAQPRRGSRYICYVYRS